MLLINILKENEDMALDKFSFVNKFFYKRLITLSFLFPIFLYCILTNNFFSKFIILFTSLILGYEWFNITQKKNIFYLFIFNFLIFLNLLFSINTVFTTSLILTFLFSLLIVFSLFFQNKKDTESILYLFYGYMFISIPFIIFFKIKSDINGQYILLWLLIVITSSDILSYFFGNLIKGPKILPNTSPSKTFSGTIIGIILGTFLGIIFFINFLNVNISYFFIFLFSAILAISGFFGDIFMSKIKRKFNKKDSSNFLPGHGGFLDRYDSFSFSLIILFFLEFFI
tara:strand:+ start:197 stop:1048 length:852 start_codon:yes stop_codon:yes gene_type:complete